MPCPSGTSALAVARADQNSTSETCNPREPRPSLCPSSTGHLVLPSTHGMGVDEMRVHVLALALLVHGGAEAASRQTFVSFDAPDIRPSFSFDKAYETGLMLNLTGVLTVPEARG